MRFFGLASLLAIVAACSSIGNAAIDTSSNDVPTGAGEGSSGGAGGDGGAGEDATIGGGTCAFASTATPYALPAINGAPLVPFPLLEAAQTACPSGSNKLTYELLDVDGDRRFDLVVTSTCTDASVGTSVWLVYLGSASGFASTALRFTLPPAPAASCATTTAILDMNGDLRPDWVVLSTCSDATVGASRWLYYANGPTGFAATTTPFALPPGGAAGEYTRQIRHC